MISTMIVDLDHLLATPIYQADRCSINFHPLHSYYAIVIYAIMAFLRKPLKIEDFIFNPVIKEFLEY